MNTKHTPGPWTVDDTHSGYIVAGKHASQAQPLIAKMYESSHIDANEREANGRLIAAAPELLRVAELAATLNTQTNHIGSGMLTELVDRARAAILKATNNTSAQ